MGICSDMLIEQEQMYENYGGFITGPNNDKALVLITKKYIILNEYAIDLIRNEISNDFHNLKMCLTNNNLCIINNSEEAQYMLKKKIIKEFVDFSFCRSMNYDELYYSYVDDDTQKLFNMLDINLPNIKRRKIAMNWTTFSIEEKVMEETANVYLEIYKKNINGLLTRVYKIS